MKRFYTGSRASLPENQVLTARARPVNPLEFLVDSARPPTSPSRLSSFFLTEDPADIENAGPSQTHFYEVEPIGTVATVDYGWIDQLQQEIRANLFTGEYDPRILEENRPAAQRLIRGYWSGRAADPPYGFESLAPQIRVIREIPRPVRRKYRANPAPEHEAASEAIAKYREFHRYDPRKIGVFPDSFRIPDHMYRAGKADFVTYRSRKVDPETLRRPRNPVNYIHHHESGVVCYLPRATDADGDRVDVPVRFRDAPALTRLGDCLGFCFEDLDGEKCEVESRDPKPDLYTTPDGECLLVIQSRKTVLAMMWGGSLGVFARGIDG